MFRASGSASGDERTRAYSSAEEDTEITFKIGGIHQAPTTPGPRILHVHEDDESSMQGVMPDLSASAPHELNIAHSPLRFRDANEGVAAPAPTSGKRAHQPPQSAIKTEELLGSPALGNEGDDDIEQYFDWGEGAAETPGHEPMGQAETTPTDAESAAPEERSASSPVAASETETKKSTPQSNDRHIPRFSLAEVNAKLRLQELELQRQHAEEAGKLRSELMEARSSAGPTVLSALRAEREELEEALQKVKGQRDSYAKACQEAANRIQAQETTTQELRSRIEELEGECERRRQSEATFEEEDTKLRARMVELIESQDAAENELRQTRSELEEARSRVEESAARIREQESALKEAHEETEQSKAHLAKVMSAFKLAKEKKEEEERSLRSRLEATQATLAERDEALEEAHSGKERAEKQIEELQDEVEQSHAKLQTMQQDLASVKAKCRQLVDVAKEQTNTTQEKEEALSRVQAQLDEISALREQEQETSKRELDRLKVQMFDFKQGMEKKERELAEARANEEELMGMIEMLQEQVGLAEGEQ